MTGLTSDPHWARKSSCWPSPAPARIARGNCCGRWREWKKKIRPVKRRISRPLPPIQSRRDGLSL